MRFWSSALALFLPAVEGSAWRRAITDRHWDIIDELAALPPRKKVKGESLELDAQKRFWEEGLAEMNIATIKKYRRLSALRQGIASRNIGFSDAHKKILRDLVQNMDSKSLRETEILAMAERRFDEAGLTRLGRNSLTRHFRNLYEKDPMMQETTTVEEGEGPLVARSKKNKVTQAHLDVIDLVAKQQAPGTVAWGMFKERGIEDLGLSTIERYLKKARERIAKEQQPELSESLRPISDEQTSVELESLDAISENHIAESIVRTNLITAAHKEVLDNLACSSSDNLDAVYTLATEAFERLNLVPLFYNSFLGLYFGSVPGDSPPVKEKTVNFSRNKPGNSGDDLKQLSFKEVSQEFENRGIQKSSRNTFMCHSRKNMADLSRKEDTIAYDEAVADAVGGLLLLSDREA